MSTHAVTPEASAASEPNSSLLPTDKNYRLTGELPSEKETPAVSEEKPEVHEPSEQEGASASPESETAAASEAAETQERKGPARTKTAASSESRWAKLSRENRELQEENRKLREARPSEQRETKQESQPAVEVKGPQEPKIDDIDEKTGKPKYATLADYLSAVRKYDREQSIEEAKKLFERQSAEQQQRQNEQIIQTEMARRADKARTEHPDYDELMASALQVKDSLGRPLLYFETGSHLDRFFLESERSHDVYHEIFTDVDKYAPIFARDAQGKYLMNPVRQIRELARIENSLPENGKPHAPARTITQAPRPPHQVSGKGTVAKDAIEEAVEKNDVAAYMREANARALARLNKG